MASNSDTSAKEIADYVIYLASQKTIGDGGEKEGITNLKLQKILYFIEAYYLSVKGKSAFVDDILAWEYGPVVPDIYHRFKHYENKPIFSEEGYTCSLPNEDKKIIQEVWTTFDKFSAGRLVEITHNHEPWIKAYERRKSGDGSDVISKKEMKEYYTGLFKSD